MYFSEDAVKQLYTDYSTVESNYQKLLKAYALRQFSNEQANEYAKHGFMRRIKILARCIHNIYDICPPEQSKRLENNVLTDLTINLQGFLFNTFGCLDNLAWVWAKEKDIKNSKGDVLKPYEIGFGEKYKWVHESLPTDFKNYLESLKNWFDYMTNYRHALAHRIPLYIPPYTLNDEEAELEKKLEEVRDLALKNHKFEEYEKISEELNSLGRFMPWMTHSFAEKSKPVVFHAQIISDWKTVLEISSKFLKEI